MATLTTEYDDGEADVEVMDAVLSTKDAANAFVRGYLAQAGYESADFESVEYAVDDATGMVSMDCVDAEGGRLVLRVSGK